MNEIQAQELAGEAWAAGCKLAGELNEALEALKNLVEGMCLWGSWEDGIPEAGDGAYGSVGAGFNRACDILGLDYQAVDISREGKK